VSALTRDWEVIEACNVLVLKVTFILPLTCALKKSIVAEPDGLGAPSRLVCARYLVSASLTPLPALLLAYGKLPLKPRKCWNGDQSSSGLQCHRRLLKGNVWCAFRVWSE